MSIFEAIKKLREKLTGQPGKGASITEAINDLTEGLTGETGVGASIADAISNLAEHSDDISIGGGGGGGETLTVLYEGDVTLALQYGAYSSENISVQPMDNLPDTINVVWNGVEYSDIAHDNDYYYYGASYDGEAFDFSEYPFAVLIFELDRPNDTMLIYGEQEATVDVTVSAFIEGGGIVLDSLEVYENGTYYPDEGHAYSSAYVSVPEMPSLLKITIVNNTSAGFRVYGFNSSLVGDNVLVYANKSVDRYIPALPVIYAPIMLGGGTAQATIEGLTATPSGQYAYATLLYKSDNRSAALYLSGVDSDEIITITES